MSPTDTVFVTGLAVHAYHGVMEHEQAVGQTFQLDISLEIDLHEASVSDRITSTVPYDEVVALAEKAFAAKRHRLIETAAGTVADALLSKFPKVTAVRITVHKPHAPIAATFVDVGVSILRTRHG
ncbi:Dihydroneopterin aldolase [Rhodovulum sp. PH10]|uniref:dihydroneopterin aldolase n=1 Tax=Rhodovulum sp. PH10 TaxID=1187851 RepID=UPI00027C25A6|nr:dihydroneopterin aldolase [Rhodovulum sp. PH10]EJW13703.1 Dihydroneopterin aldolase [Rhodovulum sp. PH10]